MRLMDLLATNVRQRREAMGLSQTALALKLQWSRGTLCGIESGRRNLPLRRIEALAIVLGVQPQELFGLSADSPPGPVLQVWSVGGDEPAVLLGGPIEAVRAAARLLYEHVELHVVPAPVAPVENARTVGADDDECAGGEADESRPDSEP